MTTIDVINKPKYFGSTIGVLEKAQRDMLLAGNHTKIQVTHMRRAYHTINGDPNNLLWGMEYGRGDDEQVESVEEILELLDWSGADGNSNHAADR